MGCYPNCLQEVYRVLLPLPVLDSGRAMLFATLSGDSWITGAVVYGEPNSHQHPSCLKNNEYILHHVAAHICNLSVGPRFISGDWNVEQDTLPAFDLLRRAGFRDIQDVALDMWGTPIKSTCKGKTRKDFLYLSPELQELLLDVQIMEDVWPDHAVVVGKFRPLAQAQPMWVWPTPHAFPWPDSFASEVVWDGQGDMTAGYSHLWAAIEHDAKRHSSKPVAKAMLGRACQLKPQKRSAQGISPIKKGRQGEFQPEYFGPSVRLAQWVRQTRRLQAYVRLVSSQKSLGIPKVETWSVVLHAKGFAPDFVSWWEECQFKTSDAPVCCPEYPPSPEIARGMFDSLVAAVRKFELLLKQQSRHYARFRRDTNPNLVFSDIRPSQVPGVDVLLQPIRAKVEDVDVVTGQITLDRPCEFASDLVISCGGLPMQVIHHEEDALWVEDASQVETRCNCESD